MPDYLLEVIARGKRLSPFTVRAGERITIGRGDTCELVLPDPHVSSSQFTLEHRDSSGLWARDLDNKNATELNGEALTECQIQPGDTLTAGSCRIIVRESQNHPGCATSIAWTHAADTSHQRRVALSSDLADEFSKRAAKTPSSDRQLHAFFRLAEGLVGACDRDQVFEQLRRAVHGGLSFDRFFLGVGNGVEGDFEIVHLEVREANSVDAPIRMSRSILDEVCRQKTALLVEDVQTRTTQPTESIQELGISSFMCAPIPIDESLHGALYVDRRQQDQPFDEEELRCLQALGHLAGLAIAAVDLQAQLQRDNTRLRGILDVRQKFVANSPALIDVLRRVEGLSEFDAHLLLLGAAGTGKSTMARLVHDNSTRRSGPFLVLNCATANPQLIEGELFGVSGDTTDPEPGLFQRAAHGTLLLDEIDALPEATQSKLVRVLDEKHVRPVGVSAVEQPIPVDVRVITTTNQDLKKLRKQHRFLDDLYYRISMFTIALPPLSKRGDDALTIAESMVGDEFALSGDVVEAIRAYSWPGNLWELKNAMSQARLSCRGSEIQVRDLPPEISRELRRSPAELSLPSLRELEERHIRETLKSTGDNKSRTAEILGISRETLYQKIALYGI